MSRFTNELRVIPKAAWILAGLVYLCTALPLFFLVAPSDPEMRKLPPWAQALLIFGFLLVLVVWVALVGYIYGDAKRRQLRYVMWTLLAIFIPNWIGIILYFILRDYSILRDPTKPCPGCGKVVQAGFPFCPHCGASLQPKCPTCGKPVDPSWVNCAHCGQPVPRAATTSCAAPRPH